MNKKGALVLRDILFMLIIFSGILALSSIFIVDMAGEYSNTDMNTEYYASDSIGGLGDEGLVNVSASIDLMKNDTEGSVGSWELIKGFGTALNTVLKSPVYVGKAMTTIMVALRIPGTLSAIVGNIVSFLIYVIVIFVIMSAFLRGGKV